MNPLQSIDARGLSCPQPALLTRQALQKLTTGTVEVLVDTVTSRDNVARTAEMMGWRATVEAQAGGSFRLILQK